MARCETYVAGNCTWGCCELADWIPEDLGDGGDWAANAPSHGLQVTDIPTRGSVVSYCRGDGYSIYGHCAYVLDVYVDGTFLVREMNYDVWDQYDNRVSSRYDVCGFILAPGTSPGAGGGAGAGPGGPGVDSVVSNWNDWQWWLNGGYWQDVQPISDTARALDWLRTQ